MKKGCHHMKTWILLLVFSLVFPVLPAFGDAGVQKEDLQSNASAAGTSEEGGQNAGKIDAFLSYPLQSIYQVQVKGVLSERIDGGTRIGAILYMKSKASKTVRVPDFEVRVKTEDGLVYTLGGSATNPRSIEPKTRVELSFLADIPRLDGMKLTEIYLVDVDWEVYPKKETVLVTIPVDQTVWYGKGTNLSFAGAEKKWGETFHIPGLDSSLTFTPISLTKEVLDGKTQTLAKFLVHNPTEVKEYVPLLAVEGISGNDAYAGTMVEQGSIPLDPGQRRYIHFAIDTAETLDSLNVMIPGTFVRQGQGQSEVVQFQLGRLHIRGFGQDMANPNQPSYLYGQPIAFDPVSDFKPGNVDISLVEFHVTHDEKEGYQTAMGKFKIHNKENVPVSVPVFQTELVSGDGYRFVGHRQQPAPAIIAANASVTVNYAYVLPESVESPYYAVKILDAESSSAYPTTVASVKVTPQELEEHDRTLEVYPYSIEIKRWNLWLDRQFSVMGGYNVFNLKMVLEMERDKDFIPDGNLPRIKFELIDEDGEVLDEQYAGFTGAGRLQDGEIEILFGNYHVNYFDSRTYVRVYEVIETDMGEAKRLLTTLERGH